MHYGYRIAHSLYDVWSRTDTATERLIDKLNEPPTDLMK